MNNNIKAFGGFLVLSLSGLLITIIWIDSSLINKLILTNIVLIVLTYILDEATE